MSELGKLPPQATDLENAIIGAIMLEKGALSLVADTLIPESFYKDSNKEIYQSCINLFAKGEPIDMLTVTNELKSRGKLEFCGGTFSIIELTRGISSSENIEAHARIVYQMSVKRNLIALSSTIIAEGYQDSTDALLLADTALKLVYEAVGNMGTNLQDIKSIVGSVYTELVSKNKKDELSGIPTHLTKLNDFTGGWQECDLIVVAARPAMGKTAYVLNALLTCANYGVPCAMFSLEMSKKQLTKRFISNISNVDLKKVMRNDLNDSEIKTVSYAVGKLENLPIHIDDTAGLTIVQFRSLSRRLVQNEGVKLIVIDYLQLMHGEGAAKNKSYNREQEVSAITRAIKVTAKELNVPIIALSQLSRAVESRGGDKRPLLSDLRESGSIEQDADIVMFLYRPEYYGINENENGMPTNNLCEVILAKHRNGDIGTIDSKFIGRYQIFKDYETNETNETTAENWGVNTSDNFEAQKPTF
jgi:replicative DNA helicase